MRIIESHFPSVEQIRDAVKQDMIHTIGHLLHEERIQDIFLRSLTIVAHQQQEGSSRHHEFGERDHSCTGHGVISQPSIRRILPIDETRHPHSLGCTAEAYATTTIDSNPATTSPSMISCTTPNTAAHESLRPQYTILNFPRQLCPFGCLCRCHQQPDNYRPVPRVLRYLLGDIWVPKDFLCSFSSLTRPCDDAQCQRIRETLSVIRWLPPGWFARVKADISFQSLPVHFVIQTPRLVESLQFVYNLSFEELKMKLSTRELTVNDVQSNGLNILHVGLSL